MTYCMRFTESGCLRSRTLRLSSQGIQSGSLIRLSISAPETVLTTSDACGPKPTSYGWTSTLLLDNDRIYLRWDVMFDVLVDGDGAGYGSARWVPILLISARFTSWRALIVASRQAGIRAAPSLRLCLTVRRWGVVLGEGGSAKLRVRRADARHGYRPAHRRSPPWIKTLGTPEASARSPPEQLVSHGWHADASMTACGVPNDQWV